MADESEEVNTAAGDDDTDLQLHESQASAVATDSDSDGSDAPGPAEKPTPAAAESTWSAPILSLARKATETISSGVSYAAGPRSHSLGSAASSPTEKEPENGLITTSKKLPGTLRLFFNI